MKTCRRYTSAHVLMHANTHKHTIHINGRQSDIKTQTTRSNSSNCKLNLNDGHCKFESKKSI